MKKIHTIQFVIRHTLILFLAAFSFQLSAAIYTSNADQTVAAKGCVWNSFGKYHFEQGNVGYIKVSNTSTTGYVCVDAVKLVAANGDSIRIDNSDAQGVTKVGSWTVSSFVQSGAYIQPKWIGADYLHDGNASKGAMSVTFNHNVLTAGDYEVFVRWVAAANRSNKVPFEIGGVTIAPPSTPTGLAVSNLKTTSFTLSWETVSGSNITGYDVYLDNALYGSTLTNSISVFGLSSNKSYSMTVVAKSSNAGNSIPSTPLVISTPPQNPNLNYPPTVAQILSKVYAGRGQQVLIVPGIDDGDDSKVQQLSLTAISNDETKLTIDSISYKSPNKMAFIYVKDKSQVGEVSIQIKLKDDGGTANGGEDSVTYTQILTLSIYKDKGANFVEYDTKSWEPRPTSLDLPSAGSYQKITSTTTPIESKARDFFWTKMYGYIVPTETAYYTFQGYSNEGFSFYLNLTDGVSKDFATLKKMVEDYAATWISESTLLEAGRAYYFEAYSKDIVNSQPFWLKWTATNTPLQLITDENLSLDFDITRPTAPSNFVISNLGVKDITLKWNASSDNKKVEGYNVYVDGVKQDTLISGTEYQVKGLSPKSHYTLVVVALDAYQNSSVPSKLIDVTTYTVDNGKPTVPQNLISDFATAFGVKLRWNTSKDNETKVRGYNVYRDGNLIISNLVDTVLLINNLDPISRYTFAVSSVDANYNESDQSVPYSINTISFDPNDTRDGVKKGRISINLNPLCKFDGFGVGVEYSRTSLLSDNLVTYGGFESAKFDTLTNLKFFDKSVVDASFSRFADTHDGGKWCAKLSSLANGYLRNTVGGLFDRSHTYLVRFDMKKSPGYVGDVKVQLKGQFTTTNPEFIGATLTPTTDWKTYEVELKTNYSGSTSMWYLDFISLSSGEIYYDNIQLVNKAAYKAGSPYSEIGLNLLRELKPAAVRWGGISANLISLKYSTGKGGSESTMSYGQFVNLGNMLNAKTFMETGIDKSTDYKQDSTTFKTLIEYLGGDASTKGGALRQVEGYSNLVSKSKGIILGLGNEVWGGASHFSAIGTDYGIYGKWARAAAAIVKNAPGYDSKISTAYSGRSPGNNYGLHAKMITGDVNSNVDALAIDGYLGGNMNLSPEIPLGTSQLEYYKSGFEMIQTQFAGLQNDWKEVLSLTNGRLLPFYFYEGNQTTNSYYGKVGQAICFADYYASAPLYGVPYTAIFTLKGGQYSLIQDEITYKKMPLFEVTKYINRYCTGTMLETKFSSNDKITSGAKTLTIDPVGCKAYTDSTSYSVALFSRDFENDYKIQLDIPNNVGNSSKCKIYTLHANSFNDTEILVDSISLNNFKDSILVTVPKYSLVIVRYDGVNQHYNAPLTVYTGFTRATSVNISITEGVNVISSTMKRLRVKANILPATSFMTNVSWKMLDPEQTNAYFLFGTSTTSVYPAAAGKGKNGTIKVIASTLDGTMLSDTIDIVITDQVGIEQINGTQIDLYPNPAKEFMKLSVSDSESGLITIMDLKGAILCQQSIESSLSTINVSRLKKGFYMVKIDLKVGSKMMKFIKE